MRNKLLTAFLLGLITALLFGYTRSWTESTPTDATVANQIDDFNRYLRVDTAERLEDYIGGFNASDSNEGFYHILFIENAASLSTPAANKGLLYGKLIDGKCEMVWMDEDGDEKQITSGGALKISVGDFDANSIDEDDIELANDAYLVASNAAGTADVNLIKAGTNDLATLPDGAEMASNAAPVEDEAITNKKYVDDQITAQANTRYAQGWANVASNGTNNASYNVTSVSKDSTGVYTVTWDTDFSSANYAVVVTPILGANSSAQEATIASQAAGSCVVHAYHGDSGSAQDLPFNIIAFGAQ